MSDWFGPWQARAVGKVRLDSRMRLHAKSRLAKRQQLKEQQPELCTHSKKIRAKVERTLLVSLVKLQLRVSGLMDVNMIHR